MSCPSIASITSVATSLPAAAPAGSIVLITTPVAAPVADAIAGESGWMAMPRSPASPAALLQPLDRAEKKRGGNDRRLAVVAHGEAGKCAVGREHERAWRNRRRGRKRPQFSRPERARHRKQPADEDRPQRHVLPGQVGSDEISRVVEQTRCPWHETRHIAMRMLDNRETRGPVKREQRVCPARHQRHGSIFANAKRRGCRLRDADTAAVMSGRMSAIRRARSA